MIDQIRLALGFLTILPIPQPAYDAVRLSRAARWFPLCGLLIGLLLAALAALLSRLFDPFLVAALVVTAWAILTGGLHLDGVADCADGLLPPVAPTRRLEIMRDPRIGAFGTSALIVLLLLKTAALAPSLDRTAALVLAPLWARWTLLLAAHQPPARQDGLGMSFAAGLTGGVLLQALASAAGATLLVLLWRGHWLVTAGAVLAAHGVTLASIALARRRLHGLTGDVFGLVVESSELMIVLAFALKGALT